MLSKNPDCNPECRACHYKDLDYPEQIARKTAWANAKLGGWGQALLPIMPAPERERLAYRSKSWMRSSLQGETLSFGMLRSRFVDGGWEEEFVSWDTCPLHIPPIQTMLARLSTLLVSQAREFSETSLVGVWIGAPHLVIIARHASYFEKLQRLDWASVLTPPFDRAWFHANPQVGRKIFGHHDILPLIGQSVGITHPIRAFRQVAQSLLTQARAQAVKDLLEDQPDFVLDLYCGTGDLSLLLPSEVGWIGIELAQEAAKFADGLRSHNHAAFVGAVEHRLADPQVIQKIKSCGRPAVFLNPPRSGLSDEARDRIILTLNERPPSRIVYLSCSASALARDLASFESAGYTVQRLQPYDFFPQTEHFEILATLHQ